MEMKRADVPKISQENCVLLEVYCSTLDLKFLDFKIPSTFARKHNFHFYGFIRLHVRILTYQWECKIGTTNEDGIKTFPAFDTEGFRNVEVKISS